MIFREATPADIPQIQVVRHAVKENTLSDPALVTDADCEDYLTRRGKGWVCECDGQVVGFSIGDLQEHNVWALFVHPDYEAQGIGKHLHNLMLQWYFGQTNEMIWLGTAPGTRAAVFYARQGWKSDGELRGKELRFEMSREDWTERHVGYDLK